MAAKVLILVAGVSLGMLARPGPVAAVADPALKCERTIQRATSTFFRTKLKLLHKCEKKKVRGKLEPDVECLFDEHTAEKIDDLYVDLSERVMKSCGGDDRTCGTADDVSLAEVGWGAVTKCPNFENGDCDHEIVDCDDVADCVACVGEAAADQAIDLYYGDLDPSHFGERSEENSCQLAIGNASIKFVDKVGRELLDCWKDRLSGKESGPCPDEDASDDIAKAEDFKVKVICKSCGGGDDQCGGGDDLSPTDVGFLDECPDVNPPSGGSCGGAIVDLEDLVECVDCVSRFKADCVDRIAIPGLTDYPPECNDGGDGTTTTTITSTTTSTSVPVTCGNGVLDPGEECDPSSPGGAFTCQPGETCQACQCVGPSTTSTTTPTTSTTVPVNCGNGILDPGEECDPGSPGGAFTCPPGETCQACLCVGPSTTTSTTIPATCGNGVLDPGEECDASSPSGALVCGPGCDCVACVCEPTGSTTTSTLVDGSTTSTSLPGSTSTTIVT